MEKNLASMSFDDMANHFISHLKVLGYSSSRVNHYRTCIKQIKSFLEQNNYLGYNAYACEEYIKHQIDDGTYLSLPRRKKDEIRCANAILEYHITGAIKFRTTTKERLLLGIIGSVIQNYLEYRKSLGAAKDTLDTTKLYLMRFQDHLQLNGITDIRDISNKDILSFVRNLGFYSKGTIHCTLCTLRVFLKYLYQESFLDEDMSFIVPKDNYRKEAKLPTTYEKNEIQKIISAIDRGNPKGKRDYAIILLAVRLGLRASDICQMKFENLLWEQNTISLTQCKTRKRIELPLLSEIGNAIIDYLKYGRPFSESQYVFLHVNPSYERLQEPTIHSIVSQYMRIAGIENINKKKHGPHALRHSLANFLMERKTPLPIISEVLGHCNTESTKTYLRIDLQSLKQCALEVPQLNTSFYQESRCCRG